MISWQVTKEILLILIGPAGIVLGIVLNEHYKRKDQLSLYGEEVFKRRLKIYEELYRTMEDAYGKGRKIIKKTGAPVDERREEWSTTVLSVADFLDKHKLYINENISLHCMLSLIGVEDLAEKNNEKQVKVYYKNWNKTKDLIKEDSGLKRLDNFFSNINKPNITSDYISAMDTLRKKKGIEE